MQRRHIVAVVAALLACACGQASAQGYPTKPIRLVLPYPPGGATDITGRIVADRLAAVLGQPVVVDNKAGAGGQLGTELVAKAPSDGYTVLFTTATMAFLPFSNKSFSLRLERDLVPVGQCCAAPLILAVNASLPVRNVQELASYLKTNSGKVNFGASGVSDAAAGKAFANAVGFSYENIRYPGGAPATQALLTGDVHYVMLPLGTIKAQVDAGKLRILAVTTPQRYPGLPDVPTLSETVAPGFQSGFWNGLWVPAGTAPEIVTRLNTALNTVLQMDEVRRKIADYHMTTVVVSPAAARAAFLAELQRAEKEARELGLRPE